MTLLFPGGVQNHDLLYVPTWLFLTPWVRIQGPNLTPFSKVRGETVTFRVWRSSKKVTFFDPFFQKFESGPKLDPQFRPPDTLLMENRLKMGPKRGSISLCQKVGPNCVQKGSFFGPKICPLGLLGVLHHFGTPWTPKIPLFKSAFLTPPIGPPRPLFQKWPIFNLFSIRHGQEPSMAEMALGGSKWVQKGHFGSILSVLYCRD